MVWFHLPHPLGPISAWVQCVRRMSRMAHPNHLRHLHRTLCPTRGAVPQVRTARTHGHLPHLRTKPTPLGSEFVCRALRLSLGRMLGATEV